MKVFRDFPTVNTSKKIHLKVQLKAFLLFNIIKMYYLEDKYQPIYKYE